MSKAFYAVLIGLMFAAGALLVTIGAVALYNAPP